jgi:hypothetical protein
MADLCSKVETCYQEWKNEIELQFNNNFSNQESIEEKEFKLLHLISQLEWKKKEKYNYFKYKYYKTKLAATSDEKESEGLRELLEQYEQNLPGESSYEEPTAVKVAEKIETNEEEAIRLLAEMNAVNSNFLIKFQNFIIKKHSVIKSLSDYSLMVNEINLLYIEISNMLARSIDDDVAAKLNTLNDALKDIEKAFTLQFFICVKTSKDPTIILFDNVVILCSADIKKHKMKLNKLFHPDKLAHLGIDDEEKKEFYFFIENVENKMKTKFTSVSESKIKINEYESKADDFASFARDFFRCSNGEWNNFEKLTRGTVPYSTSQEHLDRSKHFAILGNMEYKIACKIADKYDCIDKKVGLRIKMAYMYKLMGKLLEAQLVSLSTLLFIKKYCDKNDFRDKLKEIDTLLNQINLTNCDETEIQREEDKTALVVFGYNDIDISSRIEDRIRRLSLLIVNRSTISINTPKTALIRNLNHVKMIRNVKIAGTIGVGGTGLGVTLLAAANEINAIAAVGIGGAIGGPFGIAVASGVSTAIVTGIVCYKLIKNSAEKISKERNKISTCENVNKIMIEALNEYDIRSYMSFLKKLSDLFDEVAKFEGKTVNAYLSLDENNFFINTDNIIESLLELESSPDGIAYLLNLIANVLMSGTLSFKKLTFERYQTIAMDLLDKISSDKLKDRAQLLDRKISLIRLKLYENLEIISRKKIFQKFFKRNRSDTKAPDEFIEDSITKGSFKARLAEICLIAKINNCILIFVSSRKVETNIKVVKVYLDEIFKEMKNINHLLDNELSERFELLEFLYNLYSEKTTVFEDLIDEENFLTFELIDRPDQNYYSSNDQHKYIKYLQNLINDSKNKKEIIELYLKKANTLYKLAEKLDENEDLECFKFYKLAQVDYKRAHDYEKECIQANIGVLKSFIKLKQYQEAYDFSYRLVSYEGTSSKNSDYFYYLAVALRHLGHFEIALHAIRSAEEYGNSTNIDKEKGIITRLKEKQSINPEKFSEFHKNYKRMLLNEKTKRENLLKYKVISLDGGGIRGILPAMILCEIEKRLASPLVYCVDAFAGTSTGAIIAAGLSLPVSEASNKPCLVASDIFEFYVNKGKQIFSNNPFNLVYNNYKYNSENLYNVLKDVIKENRYMNEGLTELVIATTKTEKVVRLFTREKARKKQDDNIMIIEALMASAAAPTFFPPYKIKSEINSSYLDGGLLANNPSLKTYEELRSRIPVNTASTYVLSLGTGELINDPFDLDTSKSLLYWGKHMVDFMMSAHEREANIRMKEYLGIIN